MSDSCDVEIQKPKLGIALGSGIARGWTHIGVLRAMEEKGVRADIVAGTSIGAVVGGAYVSGGLNALEAWARTLSEVNFFRFLSFKMLGGGLFGGEKLHDLMVQSFGTANIEALDTPFTAVACELRSGHEIWLDDGRLVDALRASFALPGVFDPICRDGRWLVDGALVNPVPVSVCRAMGADVVLSINLAEDIYGRARAEREGILGPGKYGVFNDVLRMPSMGQRQSSDSLLRNLLRHDGGAPSMFANMVASLNVIQNRLSRSRLAGDPPDVSIAPKCGHVGLMEFNRADELIEIGYEAYMAEHDNLMDAISIIGFRRSAAGNGNKEIET